MRMNEITIGVSYDVIHTFIDAEGKTYITDEWNEEDVDLEVENLEEQTIINEVKYNASSHARHLIIECRRYAYIDDEIDEDDEVEPIKGLRLVKMEVKNIKYDVDGEGRYNIDIHGHYMYNLEDRSWKEQYSCDNCKNVYMIQLDDCEEDEKVYRYDCKHKQKGFRQSLHYVCLKYQKSDNYISDFDPEEDCYQ